MSAKRVREGTGSYLATPRPRQHAVQQVAPIKQIFADVPYLVVGGLATSLYMPERMTMDTDVLVHSEDLERVEKALMLEGAEKKGALTIGGSSWELLTGELVDVIAKEFVWLDQALTQPVMDKTGYPFIGLTWLVLMKLKASRVQDLADITRMLGQASPEELALIRSAVKRYALQDLEDVESMIALGQLEH